MEPKPFRKDDPVWSILPSYDMYQNTFTGRTGPPKYGEAASVQESSNSTSNLSSGVSTELTAITSYEDLQNTDSATSSSSSNPSLIVADESSHTWRETLLDNIDNLRNYSSPDNPYTQNIELSIHFTEDVGKQGVAPKHIDPSQFEYKQGDYLNGYIYIKNKYSVPIPFDMFYVLFEGNFTVVDKDNSAKKTRVKIKKYLQMYDFAASWNEARIDRLLSETFEDPFVYFNVKDSRDGAEVFISSRNLQPRILYKRFFTFKIPERLLDTECNEHNLPSHAALPPTLGFSENEKLLLNNPFQSSNDFSFVGTSTSYGVLARFIGKASNFNVNDKFNLSTKLIDGNGEEFIIFREHRSFIRVIQEANILSNAERYVNTETARILYDNLLGRIKEKLEVGHRIKNAIANGEDVENIQISDYLQSDSVSLDNEHKARQLYTRLDDLSKGTSLKLGKPKHHVLSVPLIKKKLLGTVKYNGMLQLSSPKTEYILNYMSPKRFKTQNSNNKHLWQLEIPIKIEFSPANSAQTSKIPHVTKITPELVVFTMKSGKHPIPIEITHDHLFKNSPCKLVEFKSMDDFEHIVQKPMRRYAAELYDIIKSAGCESFKVEKSLLEDVCALAAVETKTNNLALRNSKIIQNNGTSISLEGASEIHIEGKNGAYSKEFCLVVDATKAQKKAPKHDKLPDNYSSVDEFCLVPSFQNCNIARMYYLRILFQLSTGEAIELKLPLSIAKIPGS